MEDFIKNSDYVSITNQDLVEITWLIDRIPLKSHAGRSKEEVCKELIGILERHGALQFYSNEVHDVRALLDYKILSSMHGFFKDSAYESQAFIQICIDDSKKGKLKYAHLAISNYDASEQNLIMLERTNKYLGLKGYSH